MREGMILKMVFQEGRIWKHTGTPLDTQQRCFRCQKKLHSLPLLPLEVVLLLLPHHTHTYTNKQTTHHKQLLSLVLVEKP